jgi:hypothetical protein
MNPGPADTSPQGTQQAGSAIRAISRLSNSHPSPSSLAMSNESRYSASTREASDLNGRRGVAQQVFAAPLPGM